ncbi:MAG: NADH-ubiquinone oxidoreductase-F iron-sulfur binding region domain-containing protein [Bacillota bacterium]|nr:NADH-ubiquinone oxidoreductase-F iron-sulfur binding region domain-containing protein [Bacillota bacterium]
MSNQVDFISRNFKMYNPSSFEEYMKIDGFKALEKALKTEKDEVIDQVVKSGLMGRGGAAYPTGKKLSQASKFEADIKYVICNADEGEPATFKDKFIIENDIYSLLEGMVISSYTVNSAKGYIYLREEYRRFLPYMQNAIDNMRDNGYLGENIKNSGHSFDIEMFLGAGAYICGEGTALIESIEGKTGKPRTKPPYTKQNGLFYKPTLLINVETLTAIKGIMRDGYGEFTKYGTEKSPGTKLVSLSGNIVKPGVYEVPFGTTAREIIYGMGGGIKNNNKFNFLQLGGNPGPVLKEDFLDVPITYENLDEMDISLGSGAILVVDDTYSVLDFIEAVQNFFVHESCGKCTPCRRGNTILMDIIQKMKNGKATQDDIDRIMSTGELMKITSSCGLGKTAAIPIMSVVNNFKDEINELIQE